MDDVLTRNDNEELAVRTVSATEQATVVNKNDVYTRDTNGNLAIRTVGGSGGDSHNKGFFATQQALEEAYPTAEDGDFAIVGSTDTVWVWDSDTGESGAWVDTDTKGQVTSVNNQTGDVVVQETLVSGTNIKTINGNSILGSGDIATEVIQYSTLPVASVDNLGQIAQFTGTTTASYTNGYFYQCVSDGQDPATYSWTRLDVQPAGAMIDDTSTSSLTSTWSANKLNTTIGNIETLLSQI